MNKEYLFAISLVLAVFILTLSSFAINYDVNLNFNETNPHRGDTILAYANWSETPNASWISYQNKTNEWINETICIWPTNNCPDNNWTNKTISIETDWNLGAHSAIIYVSNSTGAEFSTSTKDFTVWGWSEINESDNPTGSHNDTEYLTFQCRVIDSNTSDTLQDYTLSFYKNNTPSPSNSELIGSNQTNSTGWAIFNTTIPTPGNLNIICNITDNSTSYYNHGWRNYNITSITIVDTTPPTVTLESPLSGIWSSNTTQNFTYKPFDLGGFVNCSLYLTNNTNQTWKINISTTTVNNNITNNFTITLDSFGNYTWNVWCNDTSNHSAFNTSNHTLGIDTANPSEISSPIVGDKCNINDGAQFHWGNATDSGGSGLKGYKLYRNGEHIATPSDTSYHDSGLSPGEYWYWLYPIDNANNLGQVSNNYSCPITSEEEEGPSGPSQGPEETPEFKITNETDVSIAAGESGTSTFKLTNTMGYTILDLKISLSGIDASWYSASFPKTKIDVDEVLTGTITLNLFIVFAIYRVNFCSVQNPVDRGSRATYFSPRPRSRPAPNS
ncbi:MAG: hypothetical protein ACE5KT_00765 [Methanosarcinales archaeon]